MKIENRDGNLKMELLDYTEKSFVVVGESTKNLKDSLKELGGRYNPNLTHPETKEKLAGWIFSKKQRERVQAFANGEPVPPKMESKRKPKSKEEVKEVAEVDPIQRLGLKDNGPDPPKKTRKPRQKASTESKSSSTAPTPNKLEIVVSDGSTTPEFQDISAFITILPKVGMKVKLVNESKEELIMDILETKKSRDGYVLEFRAKKDDIVLDFVLVGKEWRRMITEIPHSLHFV